MTLLMRQTLFLIAVSCVGLRNDNRHLSQYCDAAHFHNIPEIKNGKVEIVPGSELDCDMEDACHEDVDFVAKLRCNEKMYGQLNDDDTTVTCKNGEWSPIILDEMCFSTVCSISQIRGQNKKKVIGEVVDGQEGCGDRYDGHIGDVCKFQCADGYIANSASTYEISKCILGQWTPTDSQSPLSCVEATQVDTTVTIPCPGDCGNYCERILFSVIEAVATTIDDTADVGAQCTTSRRLQENLVPGTVTINVETTVPSESQSHALAVLNEAAASPDSLAELIQQNLESEDIETVPDFSIVVTEPHPHTDIKSVTVISWQEKQDSTCATDLNDAACASNAECREACESNASCGAYVLTTEEDGFLCDGSEVTSQDSEGSTAYIKHTFDVILDATEDHKQQSCILNVTPIYLTLFFLHINGGI